MQPVRSVDDGDVPRSGIALVDVERRPGQNAGMITQALTEAMTMPRPLPASALADFNDRRAWMSIEEGLWRTMWYTAIMRGGAF
jgi:hypothetical protein